MHYSCDCQVNKIREDISELTKRAVRSMHTMHHKQVSMKVILSEQMCLFTCIFMITRLTSSVTSTVFKSKQNMIHDIKTNMCILNVLLQL